MDQGRPLRGPACILRAHSGAGGPAEIRGAHSRGRRNDTDGCLPRLPLRPAEGLGDAGGGGEAALPGTSPLRSSDADGGGELPLISSGAALSTLARVAPGPVVAAGRATSRGDGARMELVVPPEVHLHVNALGGTLDAERSAGFSEWMDSAEGFTQRNLVARLFLNRPEAARRLIRLGSLSSPEAQADPAHQPANPHAAAPGDQRSPLQRRKDRKAYEEIVAMTNLCCSFGLSLPNTRALALQALHLAEKGHHALVGTALSAMENSWRTHSLAATNKGTKTTLSTYRGCVLAFCAWAAQEYGDEEAILPLSRNLVVTFLEAEKVRRVRNVKRRRENSGGQSRPVAPMGAAGGAEVPRVEIANERGAVPVAGWSGSGAGGAQSTSRQLTRPQNQDAPPHIATVQRNLPARGAAQRQSIGVDACVPKRVRMALVVDGASQPGAPPKEPAATAGGAEMSRESSEGPRTAEELQVSHGPGDIASAPVISCPAVCDRHCGGLCRSTRAAAATNRVFEPSSGVPRPLPPSTTTPMTPAGGMSSPHLLSASVFRAGAAGPHSPTPGSSRPLPSTPEAQVPPASSVVAVGAHALPEDAEQPRRVGPNVLVNGLNALAKVGSLFNLLWRAAPCNCCERWRRTEFESAGSFAPAVAVVKQRKREKLLEDQAAGTAKVLGRRDPAVTDDQRREVVRRLLLEPTTATQFQLKSRLSALFVFSFALEARGATARGLGWSDVSLRQFEAMFGTGVDVLCTYITATKTMEGTVRCVGSLPHVDAWLCPLGALSDALVASFHGPGQDMTAPPVPLTSDPNPTEQLLRARGVEPSDFWAAGRDYGFRQWYRALIFPSAQGGLFKEMTYQYHASHFKSAMTASGVPDWAARTHTCRRGAAQKGKEAGASLADNQEQGLWSVALGGGTYDAPIPNKAMALSLSGRDLGCVSPSTPRLQVAVPLELQQLICPWLEQEEAAYARRAAADRRAVDEALVDFFRLVRWCRSGYFQTWAARLWAGTVPPRSYLHRHPLLGHAAFARYRSSMAQALGDVAQCAGDVVGQVAPPLAPAVKEAVQACGATLVTQLMEHSRRQAAQLDTAVETVRVHVDRQIAQVTNYVDARATLVEERLVQKLDSVAAELRGLQGALRGILGGAVETADGAAARVPEPMAGNARMATDTTVRGSLVASAVPTRVGGCPLPLHSASRRSTPVGSSPQLVADRAGVQELLLQGKLNGVAVRDAEGQCVPLLRMEGQLNWLMALDEYAVGLSGHVSIRELDQRFGSRWRLGEPDRQERLRASKLYSSRLPLYRAFDAEYARQGRVVGVTGVASFLKRRYEGAGGSKVVLRAMGKDYPVLKH